MSTHCSHSTSRPPPSKLKLTQHAHWTATTDNSFGTIIEYLRPSMFGSDHAVVEISTISGCQASNIPSR
ncbi:hypothetical protein H257_13029 [Aphanomyces astaci]|uniref:Uncharacterized protein n=1 Tax=Aphanomyces astaci TaxID=112090 RepID=W4FYL1_APHAT|nr:hypothetical protein H257_13029 [Aphanomyces astaci]ETV71899.1 hypothetical protein H257_13029 [Aphanomyces astaci]|eukprot:XP_009838748.1 hypothetical protein H257_13029 [Aphanomyces astaci]